ncbi:hypothetical protein SEA_RIKSENGUPTA_53 [Microbacterium phage RikSengupta]|nr:hypothetical protein SEA_SPARCETUS_53 [Microbacterium phage Sparcetus]WMI33149.1 hypothetical protein SEA_RIKSENGUPTA_53 [Microbacterium phage RikSengupta]
MKRWKKRVSTGVLRWRDRDRFYGFTNVIEAGHVGPLTIDYYHDGALRNRRLFPQVNLTTLQAEAFQP